MLKLLCLVAAEVVLMVGHLTLSTVWHVSYTQTHIEQRIEQRLDDTPTPREVELRRIFGKK